MNTRTTHTLIAALALAAGCTGYTDVQSQRQSLDAADIDPSFAASILLDMSSHELDENLTNGSVSISASDVVVAEATVYEIEDASGTITYTSMGILEIEGEDRLNIRFARDVNDLLSEPTAEDAQEPVTTFAGPVLESMNESLSRRSFVETNWNTHAFDVFSEWIADRTPSGLGWHIELKCTQHYTPLTVPPKFSYAFVIVVDS